MTRSEIDAQKERFETFCSMVDLYKLGKRIFYFFGNNAKDGRYNEYVYLLRVLRIVAKVNGNMKHPDKVNDTWGCYRDIIEHKATKEFLDNVVLREGKR